MVSRPSHRSTDGRPLTDALNTPEELQAEVDRLGTFAAVARAHGISASTIRSRAAAWNIASAAANCRRGATAADDGSATAHQIEVDPSQVRWTDSDLMAFHGYDPETNLVTKRVAKRWNQALGEGKVAEMNGLTLTIEPRYPADAILPARAAGWVPPTRKAPRAKKAARVITASSDWHAPYEDAGLFDCYLQVLEDLQPDEDWDLGDLLDLPTPSRHRTTRGFEATPQECVDRRYRHDAQRVAAAPNARHVRMLGNHDERIDHAIRDNIGAHVARLARAGESVPVMDLANLLRYDELGVEMLRPDGDYHSMIAKIADGLNARHGTDSGAYGGAAKAAAHSTASQIQGHDHKQVQVVHITYDDDMQPHQRISASIGCGCQRALAQTYSKGVVHLGFAVITDHGGGLFNVEPARYDDRQRVLILRDRIYRPRPQRAGRKKRG